MLDRSVVALVVGDAGGFVVTAGRRVARLRFVERRFVVGVVDKIVVGGARVPQQQRVRLDKPRRPIELRGGSHNEQPTQRAVRVAQPAALPPGPAAAAVAVTAAVAAATH